jgi:hypothetical protein
MRGMLIAELFWPGRLLLRRSKTHKEVRTMAKSTKKKSPAKKKLKDLPVTAKGKAERVKAGKKGDRIRIVGL